MNVYSRGNRWAGSRRVIRSPLQRSGGPEGSAAEDDLASLFGLKSRLIPPVLGGRC